MIFRLSIRYKTDNVINCVLNYHAECVTRLKKDQKMLSDAIALLVVSLKLSYLPF